MRIHILLAITVILLSVSFNTVAETTPVLRYDDHPDCDSNLSSFVLQGNWWEHNEITYFFQNGTVDISGNGEQQAVADAFAIWAEVTPLTFTEVNTAAEADIIVLWATGGHGDGSNFDGKNGIIAHAFFPPPNSSFAGDVHFDDNVRWTTNVQTNGTQLIDLVLPFPHKSRWTSAC